ncbi:MAG TPA: family 20 glycosylhydrolase [Bryobacteraceae bacterium]|nr:family 20 glycosylhydrolase [Bryobacteraceae bacterium]
MTRWAGLLVAAASILWAQPQPGLMPWPAKIEMGPGSLAIGSPIRIALPDYSDPRVQNAVRRLGELVPAGSPATLTIQYQQTSAPVQQLGEDESYRLEVTPQQAHLTAPNPLGVLRGLETFRQLIVSGPQGAEVPVADIQDHPRFAWRGLHLDVARHWMPIEVVKRNLDGMAAVKLNVFHWHLSDDQGFRVESQRFPKLQQLGSDGLYYTERQVREVIEYARDRGIRVVPEFDIPGHTTSWLVGYPELASAPGSYQIERNWGVFDATMDPTRESTYEFLDAFIADMAALFPDPFFHIGGDEVTGKQWKSSARIQAFMRTHGLKSTQDLQAYFNRRLQKIVAKHGKRMEGWDEILDPDLPKEIVIQSWRGQKSLAEAARHGFSSILSAGYYLDHIEPASTLYAVDPLDGDAGALMDEEKNRILGGEVAMWGEFVSPENVDSRVWPRAAAIAERLWSPREVKDVPSMYRRLDAVSGELDRLRLTHRSSYVPMLQRLAGADSVEALKTLADVVVPATFGQRIRTHNYTQLTPLNRLVDAARPESETARNFAVLLDQMDIAQMRMWLTRWRDNDAWLKPVLEKSELLKEDVPVSAELSQLGSSGLEALDYLERKQRPPVSWLNQQRALLETLKKPQVELRFAIAPSIAKLVNLTASLP